MAMRDPIRILQHPEQLSRYTVSLDYKAGRKTAHSDDRIRLTVLPPMSYF